MSPYAPALGEPSPLLHPVMTTSPNTAGGDCSAYRPSFRSPSTPFFRSTRPSLPNPGAGFPVVTSSANRNGPLPVNTRECRPPAPGQYASPRRATGDASCFQSNSPVSGTRHTRHRGGHIHHAVHHNRHGFRARLSGAKRPCGLQPFDVAAHGSGAKRNIALRRDRFRRKANPSGRTPRWRAIAVRRIESSHYYIQIQAVG